MEKFKSVKVRVAIFFGYNGQKFQGMQYQRDTQNTVQNMLHKIICDQGFVLKTNMQNLKRIKWSRAGRTDKRVHALCNGIAVNLQMDGRYVLEQEKKVFDFDKVVKDINADLPMDVRLFTMKRVGKGFDMRFNTSSRVYNYIAPLKLFYSRTQFANNAVLNELQKHELLQKINKLCSIYLGTHSYHNLTKGYKPTDPRCDRFMMQMKAECVEEDVIENTLKKLYENQEDRNIRRMSFIRFTLIGQSFIYHQIRKMIGLLIKIFYEQLPGEETMNQTLGEGKFAAYLAPGEGLYLNRMNFDLYNKRKQPENRIELNEQDQHKILLFRKFLEERILTHELNDNVFTKWLETHDEKGEEEEVPESEHSDREE